MAVVVGVFLKPVIIVAFLLAMISPCWKRMRSLTLPSYWGLLAPLLLMLDYSYLFVVGNFWGASFSMGILSVQAPLFAITALVLIVAMALAAPPSDDEPSGLGRFGVAGKIAAWLAVAVIVVGLVTLAFNAWTFWMIWFNRFEQMLPTHRLISNFMVVFWKAKPYVCLSLGAVSLWLAFASRRSGGGEASTPPGPRQAPALVLGTAGGPPATFGKP